MATMTKNEMDAILNSFNHANGEQKMQTLSRAIYCSECDKKPATHTLTSQETGRFFHVCEDCGNKLLMEELDANHKA